MKFRSQCQVAKGPVDPAPMVDIVFLLLIFLVLSSPLVLQPGFGVIKLPESNVPAAASFQGLVVTVTRENLLFFNNQATTFAALRQVLQTEAAKMRSQELIIKADRNVPHGTVIQLMNIALESGISAVNLATRPEMPGQPAAAP
jgi:biopolymer transport protein ExbD